MNEKMSAEGGIDLFLLVSFCFISCWSKVGGGGGGGSIANKCSQQMGNIDIDIFCEKKEEEIE